MQEWSRGRLGSEKTPSADDEQNFSEVAGRTASDPVGIGRGLERIYFLDMAMKVGIRE